VARPRSSTCRHQWSSRATARAIQHNKNCQRMQCLQEVRVITRANILLKLQPVASALSQQLTWSIGTVTRDLVCEMAWHVCTLMLEIGS
jgi:hypothetical protein